GAPPPLLVERHQLLDAPAPAGDDDDIGHLVLVALPQGRHQAALRRRPLYPRGVEDQPGVGEAFPDRLLEVMDDRAARRRDQGDAARQEWECPLALGPEGALRLQ